MCTARPHAVLPRSQREGRKFSEHRDKRLVCVRTCNPSHRYFCIDSNEKARNRFNFKWISHTCGAEIQLRWIDANVCVSRACARVCVCVFRLHGGVCAHDGRVKVRKRKKKKHQNENGSQCRAVTFHIQMETKTGSTRNKWQKEK